MNQNLDGKDIKKSNEANLEKNISLYFLMGTIVALSLIFVAFEWGNREIKVSEIETNQVIEEVEDIEITQQDQNTPPPPPPPAAEVTPEEIKIVDDNVETADVTMVSVDDALNKMQTSFTPPAPVQRREEEEASENQIFEFLEEVPEFPGGPEKMMKWLNENVKYPAIAQENNIQGRVMVSFVVEKDGSVSNVNILRGVDPSLDKEAIRLVSAMPKWKPGRQTGKPVRARFNIPVTFKLR